MVLVHMPSTRTYGTDVVPTRLLKARLTIALVETLTREVIVTGEEFLLKVEMVVLERDFEGGEGSRVTY